VTNRVFPVAVPCLFIVEGARGTVTWASFGLVVFELRYVLPGGASQISEQRH
jgi:hypothetical protein